ncbi:MAG: hypothetical protein RIT81_02475 [Deltaproteobacteria bacterium]
MQLAGRDHLEDLGHPPRGAHYGDATARLILGQPEALDTEPKQRAEAALDVELAPLDLRHEPERLDTALQLGSKRFVNSAQEIVLGHARQVASVRAHASKVSSSPRNAIRQGSRMTV